MIKAIAFDWGGVLIDYPADKLMVYCARVLGIPALEFKRAFNRRETQFQKGAMAEQQLWRSICKELDAPVPRSSLWRAAVDSIFTDKRAMYACVRRLRMRFKVGVLSNTERPTVRYFMEHGYRRRFDIVVFSCNVGCVKPGKKIFKIFMRRARCKPHELIFADDKIENVRGARKLGIHAFQYRGVKDFTRNVGRIVRTGGHHIISSGS